MRNAARRFSVSLEVVIRPCRRQDLPALDWFGLFARQRPLIRSMFRRHRQGKSIMLVVEANGAVSGQAWVDLDRYPGRPVAVLWALRVLPCLQKLGIGSRLVAACEEEARRRGYRVMELAIDADNPGALRLYHRLGYRPAGGPPPGCGPADGGPGAGHLPGQLIFRKPLQDEPAA